MSHTKPVPFSPFYLSFLLGALLLSLASTVFAQTPAPAPGLTLDEYLKQVQQSHAGYLGNQLVQNGAELRSKDSHLTTTPQLFSNITLIHDSKVDPIFQTSEQTRNEYNIGVSELFDFGLTAKVSYTFDYSHYEFLPTSPEGGTPLTLNQGRPTFELSQSLWRNGLGAETRALQEASEALALSSSHSASYQLKLILAQAENAYWALSYARSAVRVTSEVLDRAQKLYDWNNRRFKLRLADDSDLLQADALLKLRKLDFQQAKDNERIASRNFNQLRDKDDDTVPEEVLALSPAITAAIGVPARAPLREDVRAAQEQSKYAVANAKVANEKDKPTFEIFGSYSLNGSDQSFSPTISNSFKTDQPTLQGGLRFVMPLNFDLMSDAHKGYALEEQGADRNYQRKFFEQENDWHDLTQRLAEARSRYGLYQAVESAQKQKLSTERDRLNRGKTTTFNVIQFEQDAAQAELSTLKAQTDILQLLAQLKTFGGAQ